MRCRTEILKKNHVLCHDCNSLHEGELETCRRIEVSYEGFEADFVLEYSIVDEVTLIRDPGCGCDREDVDEHCFEEMCPGEIVYICGVCQRVYSHDKVDEAVDCCK